MIKKSLELLPLALIVAMLCVAAFSMYQQTVHHNEYSLKCEAQGKEYDSKARSCFKPDRPWK